MKANGVVRELSEVRMEEQSRIKWDEGGSVGWGIENKKGEEEKEGGEKECLKAPSPLVRSNSPKTTMTAA